MSEIFTHSYLENKNEEGFYVPLENANTFINQIADEYDTSFRTIIIYGTNEYPLFILKDIKEILQLPDETFRRQVKDFTDYEVLKKCKTQLKIKRGDSEYLQNRTDVAMLTKLGVYRAMFISDKPVAKIFRRFVYIILHKLEKDKVVKLEDAVESLKIDYERRLTRVGDERDDLLQKTYYYREENTRLKVIEDCTSTKEAFAMDGTPEYKAYRFLAIRHMQKTPIYIVNDSYVNSKYVGSNKVRRKKVSEATRSADPLEIELGLVEEEEEKAPDDDFTEPDLENAINTYNLLEYPVSYDEIYEIDLKTYYQNMELYFHIPPFKSKAEKNPEIYHLAGSIEVYDREHLNAVRDYYTTREDCKTKMNYVFKTNYENLQSVITDQISKKIV